MLQLETIVTQFESLVRFPQNENPELPQLDDALTLPSTARIVRHPLTNGENVYHSAPDYANMDWPVWADGPFAAGVTVLHNGLVYTSLEATILGEEPGLSAKWQLMGIYLNWLKGIRKEAIRKVVKDAYTAKKDMGVARELLGNMMLFEGAGNYQDTIVSEGYFVGLEIQLSNQNGMSVILEKIALQLSASKQLNIYLWHSNNPDPIATILLDYTGAYNVQWLDGQSTALYSRDLANNLDNGLYYLGYYQDDLGLVQAIKKRFNFGSIPCGSCSNYNKRAYQKYSKYVTFKAIKVKNPPAGLKLWDVDDVVYEPDNNWGLNLQISAGCDITNYLIERKSVFEDSIKLQVEHDLLLEIANSTRTNVLKEQIIDKARGALQPEHLGGEGIPGKLRKSKDALGLEIADIEKNFCMQPMDKRKIFSSSIGI